MELTRENFRAMIYYDDLFDVDYQYQGKSASINLLPHLAMKPHPLPLWNTATDTMILIVPAVHAVQKVIRVIQDRHATYSYFEIEGTLGISLLVPPAYISYCMRKVNFCWIPHHLTKSQKDFRIDWCTQMLKKYNGGVSKDELFYKIVTGDESWMYEYI
ncbi:uncharacterized protein LOC119663534 [Teleopsis dalmanni]|uniref:uncharacterized protein LOC119663534 n=1 Tax=Teleopsis dalmanni TaxID=139649 RepID=UPI0018CC8B62|nr:uncharacterized protein LOC119663534 [Teleopsis dalmanni]